MKKKAQTKRQGRPRVDQKDYKVVNVCLSLESIDTLLLYGHGNISKGIREIARLIKERGEQ